MEHVKGAGDEILRAEGVNFEYPDTAVLKNVNFTLYRGDFLGVIGANGAGKSTLLKLILGLLPGGSGKITLFGGGESKPMSRVGYVSQKANSFNTTFPTTVEEVVLSNFLARKGIFYRRTKDDRERLDVALGRVGMREFAKKRIGELSGGQQQRVFIARALITEPELMLMDEPTVGIDAASAREIMELISELNSGGMTIVMTNHDTASLVKAANKLLIFCEHGYEEFAEKKNLSTDRIYDILSGVRTHRHG